MIIAETYKGYDIFESFGEHKAAGYKYQVALHGFLSGKIFRSSIYGTRKERN